MMSSVATKKKKKIVTNIYEKDHQNKNKYNQN